MVKENSTNVDRGGSLTHGPSIQVVAFLGFVLPPGLEVRVPRLTGGTRSDHAPWDPSAVPVVGPGESGRRDRLEGGRGAGLRRARREGRDRQIVRWNLTPGQDEVGGPLHPGGIIYEPNIRNDQANYVIEISIIVDATDPRRVRWTGVREHGQAADEDADQEREGGGPNSAPAHTPLRTPEAG